MEHESPDGEHPAPEDPEGISEGEGRTETLILASLVVGLLVVALHLLAFLITYYVVLHSDLLFEGGGIDFYFTYLTSPILEELLPFFIIFLVAVRLKVNPLRMGPLAVAFLFVGGVVIGIFSTVLQYTLLVHVLEPGADFGTLASQILTLSSAESLAYQGFELLFLGITGLAVGYFWSENPLWHPRAWLEHEDATDEGPVEPPEGEVIGGGSNLD